MKWYVVHVFAGYEFRIKEIIEKGIVGKSYEKDLGQILIPTQSTYHIRGGKKIERERKIFSNYIILEAELSPELYSYVLRVDGVTKFLGTGKKPLPLSKTEVARMLGEEEVGKEEEKTLVECNFSVGDTVRVISGAFVDFNGEVTRLSAEENKVVVNVTVFGRVTSVDLKIDQVEKIK